MDCHSERSEESLMRSGDPSLSLRVICLCEKWQVSAFGDTCHFYLRTNESLPYMRQDALVGGLSIHVDDRDQFITACHARDNVQAGFRHTQNI
jgi:hypothetical protein